MTENNDETTGRRSDAMAGTPREVSQRDENAPGAAGAGQNVDKGPEQSQQEALKEPSQDPAGQPGPVIQPSQQAQTDSQDSHQLPARQHGSEIRSREPVQQDSAGHSQQPADPSGTESHGTATEKQKVLSQPQKPVNQSAPENSRQGAVKKMRPGKTPPVPEKKTRPVITPRRPADKPSAATPVPEPDKYVFRKTELHSAPPLSEEEEELLAQRRKMMLQMRRPKFEVSYQPFEIAFRMFIASLLVRQDRIDDELRPQLAMLGEQVQVLEERLDHRTTLLDHRVDELAGRERF